MAASDATIFVCVSCTVAGTRSENPGRALFDSVSQKLAARPDSKAVVRAVDCLAVCKRPCTIALSGEGKWTYVVGNLGPGANADDVIAAAEAYGETANGIIPWRERPQSFRKGVISRIPPLSFRPEEQGL